MPAIAKVEPLTRARALRGPFDYRLPARMADVGVGSVLIVPFGHRRTLGVVVDTADASDVSEGRLVEPLSVLDSRVTPQLVELGLWVAREYCSTPARGLALVLPPGTGPGGGRPQVGKRIDLWATITEAGSLALAGVRDAEPARGGRPLGERQLEVLTVLKEGEQAVARLEREIAGARGTVRRLERRGLVSIEPVRVRRRPRETRVGAASKIVELTGEQAAALAEIVAALEVERSQAPPADGAPPPALLLHGVTGSGKTEVYLAATEAALAMGKSVIVMVPEIALTPQTLTRFRSRFGSQVAVLHSALSAGERYDEWSALRRGDARICIGPRSAVFAPLEDLGLIVIDEEHDSSYKQEQDPRYDAREVAHFRARQSGAVLVAAGATPRVESFALLPRLTLRRRVDGSSPPPVEVLDMRGVRGVLHPQTRAGLDRVLRDGQKAMILLNRRGWSAFLSCRDCGRVWECPHCDVSLTLHRGRGRLVCHHCGQGQAVPRVCPDCGSVSVARHGAGTEQLEAELVATVGSAPVFRLDSDTAQGKHAVAETLAEFDRAESGVLVGTQMIAKGHDFPEVTLGVVLTADASLHFPDFRAEERTFALVTQLAGRSGRGVHTGRVLVQTLAPDAAAIRRAERQDVEGFMADELERRRELRYPPFATLIRVVVSAEQEARAEAAAQTVVDGVCDPTLSILGPAPLFRVKDRHRFQVLVKVDANDREVGISAVRQAVYAVAREFSRKRVSFAVDVDPQ